MTGTLFTPHNAIARLNEPEADFIDIPDIPFVQNIIKNRDYSLVDIHLGGEFGGYYDSNIFRSTDNEKSDFATIFKPKVKLTTNFEDHEFTAYANIKSNIHTSNSDNNHTNLELGMDGSYTLSKSYKLFGEFDIGKRHSPIGSFVDDPSDQLSKPVSYVVSSTKLGLSTSVEKWVHSIYGSRKTYDYDNTLRRDGTKSIQDDRDRKDYNIQFKTEYILNPFKTIYMRGGINTKSYDNRIDSSVAFSRNSNGRNVLFGLSYKGLNLTGDFAVGYMHQNYKASQLPSVSSPLFLFDGQWNINKQNTVHFIGDSIIKDSTNAGVSAYIQNQFRLNYKYDLNEKLALGTYLQYINNNFKTNTSLTPISRQDKYYSSGMFAEYEIYDDVRLNFSYEYRNRQSNVFGAEYDSQIINARLFFDY